MSEHEQQAEAAERELEDMEHRAHRLGEDISGVREDWESKKHDENVPGAGAGGEADSEDEDPPEDDDAGSGG
jgi:chromosome segregation ATPase